MAPAADELVRASMARLETTSPSEFAKKIGLAGNGYQRVRRWLRSETEPDYEATMAILERCGWLNLEEGSAAPAEMDSRRQSDRLQALEAKIDDSARMTAKSLLALQRGIARLEKRIPRQEDQDQKAVQQ